MGGPAPGAPAAQGELPKSPPADNAAVAGQPSAPTGQAAANEAPVGDIIAAQADDQALASDVVGSKVVTPGGEQLGKVDDLIVDHDGKLQGAVLSVGGFLGIGDKQVAVPWKAIQQRGPNEPLVVAMSKDQLENAPEFMTLADQRANQQAALAPPSTAVPAPGAGSQ